MRTSPLWVQVVADVTGRPLRVSADGELSAAGAALLAREHLARRAARHGTQDGAASTLARAALVGPEGRDVTPDPQAVARYDRLFAVYRRLYPQLRDLFGDLIAATQEGPVTGSGS